MGECAICEVKIDRAKEFYITVNERKGPSVDVCSLRCAAAYVNDEG